MAAGRSRTVQHGWKDQMQQGSDTGGGGIMAQDLKYSSSGRMKISAGYKPGNMAAFMYGSTKRKRKKKVRGK